jgi:hypothetical protein
MFEAWDWLVALAGLISGGVWVNWKGKGEISIRKRNLGVVSFNVLRVRGQQGQKGMMSHWVKGSLPVLDAGMRQEGAWNLVYFRFEGRAAISISQFTTLWRIGRERYLLACSEDDESPRRVIPVVLNYIPRFATYGLPSHCGQPQYVSMGKVEENHVSY